MTNLDFHEAVRPIIEQIESDSDCFCFVHFSREEDHVGGLTNCDAADALTAIAWLIEKFSLSREAIAGMDLTWR